MESMKTTRDQTALLNREQLAQAAFGTLCQSFAMGILAGSRHEDGFYQQVALELLEEEAPAISSVQNILQVDLKLVLELLRRDGQKREKTQRLLEQLTRLELSGPGRSPGKAGASGGALSRPVVRQGTGHYQRTGILRWPASAAGRDRGGTVEQRSLSLQGQKRQGGSGMATPEGEPFYLTASRQTLDALLAAGWRGTVLSAAQVVGNLGQSRKSSVTDGLHILNGTIPGSQGVQPVGAARQTPEGQGKATVPGSPAALGGTTAQSVYPARKEGLFQPEAGETPASGMAASLQPGGETLVLNTASPVQSAAGQSPVPGAAPSLGPGGAALFARWVWNRERPGNSLFRQEGRTISWEMPGQASRAYAAGQTSMKDGGGKTSPGPKPERGETFSPGAESREGLEQRLKARHGRNFSLQGKKVREGPGRLGGRLFEAEEEFGRGGLERLGAAASAGVLAFPVPEPAGLEGLTAFPELAAVRPGQDGTAAAVQRAVREKTFPVFRESAQTQVVPAVRAESGGEAQKPEREGRDLLSVLHETQALRTGRDFPAEPGRARNRLEAERARMPVLSMPRRRERSGTAADFLSQGGAHVPTTASRLSSVSLTGASGGEAELSKVGGGTVSGGPLSSLTGSVHREGAFPLPEEMVLKAGQDGESTVFSTAERSQQTQGSRGGQMENTDSRSSARRGEAAESGTALQRPESQAGPKTTIPKGRETAKQELAGKEAAASRRSAGQDGRKASRAFGPGTTAGLALDGNGAFGSALLIHNMLRSHSGGGADAPAAPKVRQPADGGSATSQEQRPECAQSGPESAFPRKGTGFLDIRAFPGANLLLRRGEEHTSALRKAAARSGASLVWVSVRGSTGRVSETVERAAKSVAPQSFGPKIFAAALGAESGAGLSAKGQGSAPREPEFGGETALLLGVAPPSGGQSSTPGTGESREESVLPSPWTPQNPVQGQAARTPEPTGGQETSFLPEKLAYGPVQRQESGPPQENAGSRPDFRIPERASGWSRPFCSNSLSMTADGSFQRGIGGGPAASARQTGALGQLGGDEPQQIEWTAPGLSRRPAEISFRKREPAQPPPAPALSDRELQRAADQVYRMIEDRLRQERRRLDL